MHPVLPRGCLCLPVFAGLAQVKGGHLREGLVLLSFEQVLRLSACVLSVLLGFTSEERKHAEGCSYLSYTSAEAGTVSAPRMLIGASLCPDMPKCCQKSDPEWLV